MNSEKIPYKTTKTGYYNVFLFNSKIFLPLILFLTLLSFIYVLYADFVFYDDDVLLFKNNFIRKLDLELIRNSFQFNKIVHYHPLVYLSYAVEYSIFGLSTFGYHLTNLLLHCLNAALVYLLIHKLSNNKAVSFLTALFFAIHPLHVESVAWITERKDMLYSLFYIGSLIFFISYLKKKENRFYILALLLFIFSCLSKAMAVTLPFVLILARYKITGSIKSRFKELFPFILVSAVFLFININVAYYKTDLYNYSFYDRLALICFSFLFYPYKLIIPLNLSVIYVYPQPLEFIHLVSPLIVLLIIILLIKFRLFNQQIRFGFFFYLFTILPVLPIVPFGISLTADRFSYLPSIGLFYIISIYLNNFFEKIYEKKIYFRRFASAALIIYILALSFLTFNRSMLWTNTETLMGDALEHNGRNYYAYFILGNYYSFNNNYDKAIDNYNSSIKIKADYSDAYINLGSAYFNRGNFDESIKCYLKVIEIDPSDEEAYNNLGVVYENTGNIEKAIEYYRKSAVLGYEPAIKVLKYYGYSW